MTMRPGLRKFVRTADIPFTVGWLGAVAGFLVLAIIGLTSPDAQIVRASYLAMKLITRFVIVPFSFILILLTGTLLSLGTSWVLFQHYWIVVKFLINIVSTILCWGVQAAGHDLMRWRKQYEEGTVRQPADVAT